MTLLPLCVLAGLLTANEAELPRMVSEPPITLLGVLLAQDAKDPARNQPCKKYAVSLRQGQTYIIEMQSTEFDCFLRLLDPQGKQLAQDDDGGGMLNSRIVFMASTTGTYQIIATTYNGSVGFYNLRVSQPAK